MYNKDENAKTEFEVQNGKVLETSTRAGRLSLNRNCSLIINDITAEDAGRYFFRIGQSYTYDTFVYLNILMSEYCDFPDIVTASVSISFINMIKNFCRSVSDMNVWSVWTTFNMIHPLSEQEHTVSGMYFHISKQQVNIYKILISPIQFSPSP